MLKRIFSTASYSFLSRFLITASNLFFIYFISKNLGADDLGIYGIIFFFYQLFASISSMNLYQFFGKEIAGVNEDRKKGKIFFDEFFSVTVIGIFIALFFLLLIVLFYSKVAVLLLVLVFPAGILLGIERNLSGILLGIEKMKFEFYSNLISFLIIIVSVLINGDLFLSIANLLLLKIISQFFAVVIKLFPLRDLISLKLPVLKLKFFREGKFFWFSGLSNLLLRQADIFILSFFIGKSLLGSYFLAIRIYYFFGLIAEIFSFALTPFISRTFLGKEDRGFKEFNIKLIKLFSVFAILSSLVLYFGRDLIVNVFSGDQGNTSAYLTVFSVLVFFKFMSYLTGNILTSTKFQNIRFYISSTSSLILIVLNLILVPFLSVNGAIIARSVAEILLFFAFGFSVFRMFRDYKISV